MPWVLEEMLLSTERDMRISTMTTHSSQDMLKTIWTTPTCLVTIQNTPHGICPLLSKQEKEKTGCDLHLNAPHLIHTTDPTPILTHPKLVPMATPMEHHTEPHRLMATPGDRILEGAATTPVVAVAVVEVVVEVETHTVQLTALVTTPHEVVEDRAAVVAETAAEAVVEVEVVEVVVAEVEVVGEEAEDRQIPGISSGCS